MTNTKPPMYRAFIKPGVYTSDRTVFRYHYKTNIVTMPAGSDFWNSEGNMSTTATTRRKAAARLRSRYNRMKRSKSYFSNRYRLIP